MAAKKKKKAAPKRSTKKPDAYDRTAPRKEEWSEEWIALFRVTGGSPKDFAEAVGISYQTIWRAGVKGEKLGKGYRFMIQMFAKNHGLLSPV